MVKLADDEFVTIELVHDPPHREINVSTGLSYFVIKVEWRSLGEEAVRSDNGSTGGSRLHRAPGGDLTLELLERGDVAQ